MDKKIYQILDTIILYDLLTHDAYATYYQYNDCIEMNIYDKNIDPNKIDDLLIEIKYLINEKYPLINVINIEYIDGSIKILLSDEIYQITKNIKNL